MHNARLYRWMAGLILVSVPLGALLQQTPQQVRMEQDPLSRTRKHIVDCVEPLCREVLPREDRLLFHAMPIPSTSLRKKPEQIWSVECLDAGGEQRLQLLWNEDSKKMISLSQVNLREPLPSHPISKSQAVQKASEWMERLAFAPRGGTQQCACTAEKKNSAYAVNFHLKEQNVTVCINAYSNELVLIFVSDETPVHRQ